MPADDVDLTLMIREGQNSVGQNDPVVRALEIILMRSGGADPVGRGLEIVLTKSGVPAGGLYHTPRSGCPESMRLALDILEGQKLARKNDHRVSPRRAGASELPAVDVGVPVLATKGALEKIIEGLEIVLTEMGVPTPLVGEGPERHRPKSRRSLPPSMPSTVTPRTSSIFTKAAALVVVPTHTSCAFAMACSRVMGPRSRSHPRPG